MSRLWALALSLPCSRRASGCRVLLCSGQLSEDHACLCAFVLLVEGTGGGVSQKEAEDEG